MIKLSCVIPSYKDPYMVNTVNDLLAHSELGDGLEIIVVLDGFWPEFKLVNDSKVRYVHLGKNRGMRGAINAGVLASRGEYIMRADEHCMFAKGFDKVLTDDCEPNWIITARRYFLDPTKWERMKDRPVDCEKLVIQGGFKFSGQRWESRSRELKHEKVIESMAMQGSMWLMPRKWWDKVIVELQTEGYGPLYQDSHEMVFKTWKHGGKLMIDKNTWFAHKHRSFSRTHNYGTKEATPGWKYSLDVWREYYEKEIKPKWKI